MYHFLQKNKEKLVSLEGNRIADLLSEAKEYIEKNYEADTDPA